MNRHKINTKSNRDGLVLVPQRDLDHLQREINQLKTTLAKLTSHEYVQAYSQTLHLQRELERLQQETEALETEQAHWKSRCDAVMADLEAQKQEKFQLQCEMQETTKQLGQQSEYCATMGAACCTLLWRVTRCEESIQAILSGSKVEEFLSMVASTLDSYLHTYKDDIPKEETEETQFILALCGIVTNIAASACGREYLMTCSQGAPLLDTFLKTLSDAPSKQCAKMKNLILMTLYNISISQKGLKHISSRTGVLGLLVWLIQQESDVDNRVNALRLIQSLLYEQHDRKMLLEAKEVLSLQFLQQLANDRCVELKEAAQELVTDLQHIDLDL